MNKTAAAISGASFVFSSSQIMANARIAGGDLEVRLNQAETEFNRSKLAVERGRREVATQASQAISEVVTKAPPIGSSSASQTALFSVMNQAAKMENEARNSIRAAEINYASEVGNIKAEGKAIKHKAKAQLIQSVWESAGTYAGLSGSIGKKSKGKKDEDNETSVIGNIFKRGGSK